MKGENTEKNTSKLHKMCFVTFKGDNSEKFAKEWEKEQNYRR